MHDFTIRIETPKGATINDEKAATVEAAIAENGEVSAVATRHSTRDGTISSVVRVSAATLDDAQDVALRVFIAALTAASISWEHGWLIIEAGCP